MQERGISLIALIITIIVIIILAAISIAGVSGMVERSRYAKFCGDLDAVQDAVSQAYGDKLVKESLENQGQKKTSKEIYEWVAGGEDPQTEEVDGKTLAELEESDRLGLDLPKYGDGKWYVDVNTGEVYLLPGFVYGDEVYTSKADIQKGGSQGEGGNNTPTPPGPTETPIDTETDYTGYYAYVNGEYGIIFADLAIGSDGEQEWFPTEWRTGIFTIPMEPSESLKQYYVTQEIHTDEHFGSHPVLAPLSTGNEGKKDRFYVMALSDVDSSTHTWYKNAFEDNGDGIIEWNTLTKSEFGTGKTNTENMMKKYWNWNEETEQYEIPTKTPEFGEQDSNDMWYVIKDKVEQGWFVPSIGEWSAFAYNLTQIEEDKLDKFNYNTKYGLSSVYWPSTLPSAFSTYTFHYDMWTWGTCNMNYNGPYVRLATTF